MKALLIIAHGSRQAGANAHLEELATGIRAETGDDFAQVKCAYLQHSHPEAGEMIKTMAKQGIRHITILPFFLGEGGHVRKDIPELVGSVSQLFPAVTFEIKPFLGGLPGLKELILNSI